MLQDATAFPMEARARLGEAYGSGGSRAAMTHRLDIGGRYHLTSVRSGDREAYVRHLGSGEIAAMIPAIPQPYDLDAADRWIDHRLAWTTAFGAETSFAIREHDGTLVGAVGVDDIPSGAHEGELGYWVACQHRGCGVGTRAVERFIVYAFESLGLAQLTAHTYPVNETSIRLLDRVGFSPAGRRRVRLRPQGAVEEVLVFRLLQDSWRSHGCGRRTLFPPAP